MFFGNGGCEKCVMPDLETASTMVYSMLDLRWQILGFSFFFYLSSFSTELLVTHFTFAHLDVFYLIGIRLLTLEDLYGGKIILENLISLVYICLGSGEFEKGRKKVYILGRQILIP